MSKKINLNKMCDKCLKIVDVEEGEKFFGFVIEDDYGNSRAFRGHEVCIAELGEMLMAIYGNGEKPVKEGDKLNEGQF